MPLSSGAIQPTLQTRNGADQIRLAAFCQAGPGPKATLREILNAIPYLARAGCGWCMLPMILSLADSVLVFNALWEPLAVPTP